MIFMKIRLIFILSICYLSIGFCQDLNRHVMATLPLSSEHKYIRASYEISNFEHYKDAQLFVLPVASISIMPDQSSFYHISMNPFFTIAGLLVNSSFYFLQAIPNIRIKQNLYKEYIHGMLGLNTDYFMFYKVSRIYSEVFIGIKYSFKKIATGIHLCIPFSKGYLNNANPYLCFTLSYDLEKVEPPNQVLKLTE
jgi:hypothetical protein